MKWKKSSTQLLLATGLLGILALVLRWLLYAKGVDARGLLLRRHPLELGVWAVSACALAVILWATRKQQPSRETAFGRNLPGAFGCAAAGAGILVTVLTAAPGMGNYLETAWRILGFVSPVCLLLAAFFQVLGKRPFFLLHVAVCLFFMLHIVTRYQLWSGNPQLQDYLFSLLGAMALLLFGFYTAAREADCGNAGMHLGMGLAAVYLCFAELARSACPGLYLGGLLWVLTELLVTPVGEKS